MKRVNYLTSESGICLTWKVVHFSSNRLGGVAPAVGHDTRLSHTLTDGRDPGIGGDHLDNHHGEPLNLKLSGRDRVSLVSL